MLTKSPKHTALIICEDIRTEAGNKTTLCGIYSNGIIFQESESVKTIPQLCVYGLFEAINEDCEVIVSILTPSGAVVFETPPMTITPNSDGRVCIGVKIHGVIFHELGAHKVIFKFDKKKVVLDFSVSTGVMPV